LIQECEDNKINCASKPGQYSTERHVTRRVPEDYLKFYKLSNLGIAISECQLCRKAYHFASLEAGINHLQQSHAESANKKDDRDLPHWLLPASLLGPERRIERLLEFVQNLRLCTEKLLSKAIEIRSSVADKDSQRSAGFLLPTALVKAAEKTFQFIYYSAYSVQQWRDIGFVPPAPSKAPPLLSDRTDVSGAEYVAKIADIALSNARDELMLMAHTGESRNPVVYVHTTPETNVLLLSALLFMNREVRPEVGIFDMYEEHLVRLVSSSSEQGLSLANWTTQRYEASRRPSKRVLRELYLWKEELEILESVVEQQLSTLRGMKVVFDSDNRRITNRVRIEAFKGLEIGVIEQVLGPIAKRLSKRFQRMNRAAERLAETLRYNIAIAEEGDSKAILIFTLVTIVFLPLSFVSSVFGMNTVEIRDMNSTQSLFWAVALPVTATVGGLSMLAAYGGPTIRQYWKKLKKIKVEIRFVPLSRSRADDEERSTTSVHNEKSTLDGPNSIRKRPSHLLERKWKGGSVFRRGKRMSLNERTRGTSLR
jgi:hypothetical protein